MSTFLDGRGSSAAPDDEEVLELLGGSLDHLHMTRSLDRIAERDRTLRRRRTAVTTLTATTVATLAAALSTAIAFTPSRPGTHEASTADGTARAVGVSTVATTGPPRLTDDDWRVRATPGAYTVEITALGDVARLNTSLRSLSIDISVAESAPSGSWSGCPTMGDSTPADTTAGSASASTATSTSTSTSTSASTSTATSTSASPSATPTSQFGGSPTPLQFAGSGTPAEFAFGQLPEGTTITLTATSGIGGTGHAVLGILRFNAECLPVFASP